MLICASDGAALVFFGGLCKKARAAAACVGFATTGSREPWDGYFSVFIVITMFFLDLPWSVPGRCCGSGLAVQGIRGEGKPPNEGPSDTW
jgi:hypothetical protein